MNDRKIKGIVIIGLLIAIVLVISGCIVAFTQSGKIWLLWIPPLEIEELPTQIAPPVSLTTNLQEVSTENIDKSKEITTFRISKDELPIIAISEDIGQQILMAINTKGEFGRWEMESQTVVKKFDFHAAYPDSTNFSEDGSRLLATGGNALWDTTEGTIVSGHTRLSIEDAGAKVLLDPTGSLIIYPSTSLDVEDLRNKQSIHYPKLNDCLFTELGHWRSLLFIQRITIDRSGTYLAYILPNGVVCIRELNRYIGYFINDNLLSRESSPIGQLRFDLPGEEVETKFAAFDPTNNWLAVVTENELVVWDLQNFFFPLQINKPIKGGTTLAFDQSGKVLALGTTRGIQLFDVEQSKLLSEIEMDSVTALFFSRDNRLLIIGDTQGIVHIFGVPK